MGVDRTAPGVASTVRTRDDSSTLAPSPFEAEAPRADASAGPRLRADGSLERAPNAPAHRATAREEPLELDLPKPPIAAREETFGLDVPRASGADFAGAPKMNAGRRRLALGFAIAAAVALLAISAVRLFGPVRNGAPRPMLRVDSAPEGAEIFLGGELLGTTPYIGDNDLPPGNYKVRIERPGFRSWSGSFEGGRDAHMAARLRPAGNRGATPEP
jgi:hypothetical protein